MKNKRLIIPFTLLIAMLVTGSCEKMDDFHYKYIKDGEIRYTSKVLNAKTYPGNGRVLIKGFLWESFGVEKIMVYYNDYNDSVIFDYNREGSLDSLDLMINGLEEKAYSFDIYTGNSEGNRSVKVTSFATSYGEKYRQALKTRAINSISTTGDTVNISWLPADELERGTEMSYTDTLGNQVSIDIYSQEDTTILYDFRENINLRSFYVPEGTAIDTFSSDWMTMEIELYKSEGSFTNPLTGTEEFNITKILYKVDEDEYEADFANKGEYNYRMILTINADNTVTVTSAGETPLCESNGENVYDPVTETFTLNYKYDYTGGYRFITETLVKR